MGIFDDEKPKIAEETEPRQIALCVCGDLLNFLANNPDQGIKVESHENPIILRRKSSGKTLEITCDGPDTFQLKESSGFQTQVNVQPQSGRACTVTLSEMVRRVRAF